MQSSIPSSDSKKIEVFISGRQLRDKDYFSKSDPYVVFLIKNNNQFVKFDRTETIKDCLNPNFVKSFVVEYIFEQKQECRFDVFDDDGTTSDFLGSCETTIGKIMGAQKQISILDIKNPKESKPQGKLIIRGDNLKESNEFVFMKWCGIKLMNTDGWFDKSDPLMRISKMREDKTIQKIFETEHIMDNLNPSWKPFELPASRLCDADYNKLFKIEVWDWEKNGKFQFIGEIDVTLKQLKDGQKDFELRNQKKKSPGKIRCEQFQIIVKPSFLDYIRGGLQLNLILAVDFTGSNGIPTAPSSLHYMNPQFMNQYQQAIVTVGEILLAYDYDQRIPCYGFGAKTRFPSLQSNQTLHCFPLSGNPNNVEGLGIQNILELYNYSLHNVELSGPTYFGPIINESMKIAQMTKDQEQNVYTILLILTDGEIHDMNLTKNYIVQSSHIPLSVIIVGIGQADFGNMEVLDGDSGLQDENGRKAARDVVQFVPLRNVNGNPVLLAKQVLAEIPEQVIKYHQLMGKKPNNPVIVDVNQMGFTSVQPSGPNMNVPPFSQQMPPPQGALYTSVQKQPSNFQGGQQPPPYQGQLYQSQQGPPPLQGQPQGPPPYTGQQQQQQHYQGPPPIQGQPPSYQSQQGPPPFMGQSQQQQAYQGPPPNYPGQGLHQSYNPQPQHVANPMMNSQPYNNQQKPYL